MRWAKSKTVSKNRKRGPQAEAIGLVSIEKREALESELTG
jgi:hypothetical protein